MEKIVLALSGGVDSAVSVHLLREQGYEVYGYTFLSGDDKTKNEEIVRDAKAVAAHFGIPHDIEDLAEDFHVTVISYFIDSYLNAKTPNPCVFCNKTMKFPKLLSYADSLGIKKVATGHYARMQQGRIYRAANLKKDQSYVLSLLPEAWYPRIVFPLGDYDKPRIRAIAEGLGLPVAHKGDSQEICFVPNDDYKSFLKAHAGEKIRCGNFMDTAGHILGRHNGIPFYTVGQRRGIGIAFGEPKYVIGFDRDANAVMIGDGKELFADACRVKNVNLIGGINASFSCTVKIRYQGVPVPATVSPTGEEGIWQVHFESPQKSVTPGQYAVFYDGDLLLGGAEILSAH